MRQPRSSSNSRGVPAAALGRSAPLRRAGAAALLVLAWSAPAAAQEPPAPLPHRHIPPNVLLELRALENQFDLALSRDCAPERCVSKGCVYREHATVDLPKGTSLPGLGQQEGPGSVPAQEYLTQARCDFAHERGVAQRDVEALVRRLQQRLSRGWLVVSVGRSVLEPISPALSAPPPERPDAGVPAAPPPPPAPPPTPEPPRWSTESALRELWLALLPHSPWMVAILMLTLATVAIIWALRRVGARSLEEEALAAQLRAEGAPAPGDAPDAGAPGAEKPPASEGAAQASDDAPPPREAQRTPFPDETLDAAYVAEQERLWRERFTAAPLGDAAEPVAILLRRWLADGAYPLLAKAVLLFGDRLMTALAAEGGELGTRKLAFAQFLAGVSPQALPSSVDFFRTLNRHASAATLLAQSDARALLELRDSFGAEGIAQLLEALSPRLGALLYAMTPPATQRAAAPAVPSALRAQLATELLFSNRMADDERDHLLRVLEAARRGAPLPQDATRRGGRDAIDCGVEIDSAGALSRLLQHLPADERQALLRQASQRQDGALPDWYGGILFPDMLLRVPPEALQDLLLEIDLRELAAWLTVQPSAWREGFVATLPASLGAALKAAAVGVAVGEREEAARRAQGALVAALARRLASGSLSLADLWS